jgi:hypothetical protein
MEDASMEFDDDYDIEEYLID